MRQDELRIPQEGAKYLLVLLLTQYRPTTINMGVEVLLVPQGPTPASTLQKLGERYRTARLRALREDPDAFSSTYEREVQFEPEEWVKRLQNPEAKTFVAIRLPAADTETGEPLSVSHAEKLAENEWLGMIVLIGPRTLSPADCLTPWKPFTTSQKDGNATTSTFADQEITYFAVSMFVFREMRRQGLGRKLIEISLDTARQDAASLKATKLTIGLVLAAENTAAMDLYRKCGFVLLPPDPNLANLAKSTDEGISGMGRTLELTPTDES